MVSFLSVAELDEQRNEWIAKSEAIIELAKAEKRDLSDDEVAAIDEILNVEIPAIDEKRARGEKLAALQATAVKNRMAAGAIPTPSGDSDDILAGVRVPARAKTGRQLKAFADDREAYSSGQFLAAVAGNEAARQWCVDHGFRNAMSEGTNSAGGFVVPTPLSNAISRLVEEYGVFRQHARNVPMTADTLLVPRRTAGLTVFYPNEGSNITASDLTFAQDTLTAKMYSQLAIMSTELNEDSVISMADLIATEFAYGFANAEDTNGFIGDGTSTYASVTGVESALNAAVTYDADSGETTVASLDFGDYESVKALVSVLPGARNKWYCNSTTWNQSMCALANAAGGNTIETITNGTSRRAFLGDEVVISQVLPDDGASNIVAYYGDLSLTATVGVRRDVSISTLRELYAASNQIGMVATQRTAITVVQDGTTAGQRPLACLKLAAS